VYFESNRFDESSLHKWENKARKAYDRMVAGAPTVSKAKLNAICWNRSASSMAWASTSSSRKRLEQWLQRANALDTAPAGPVTLWKTK
jgi:hypothetical protein